MRMWVNILATIVLFGFLFAAAIIAYNQGHFIVGMLASMALLAAILREVIL